MDVTRERIAATRLSGSAAVCSSTVFNWRTVRKTPTVLIRTVLAADVLDNCSALSHAGII